MTAPAPSISWSRFMSDPNLAGRDFAAASWTPWKILTRGAFGESLSAKELRLFQKLAGREPPNRRVRRLWLAIGRRSGKDSIASAILAWLATFGGYERYLRRGEVATIVCLAVDRAQAALVFSYTRALFEGIPLLHAMLVSANDGVIKLINSVEIVIATNSFRGIRGRSIAVAVLDECAFYRDEYSASPDVELYAALRPAQIMFRDAGPMIIGISSVHRKRGLLYTEVTKYLGKDDTDTLAILQPSVALNPTLAEPDAAAEIEAEIAADPERANAEWNSVWRSDLTDLFDRETIAAAVDDGVLIREPQPGVRYRMAVDPSGGRGDSFAASIGHVEGQRLVVDLAWEKTAPFDVDVALDEVCGLARQYRVREVHGDDYGADLVVAGFRRRGIKYSSVTVIERGHRVKLSRSEIYLNSVALFAAGRVHLPDHPKLSRQLTDLERRAVRGSGHDQVDHPRGRHDDLANACCACLVMLTAGAGSIIRVGERAMAWASTPARGAGLPGAIAAISWWTR